MKNLLKKILAFFHIPWDKFLHCSVCAGATLIVALGTFFMGKWYSIIAGGLFALGLGLGKEYGDSKASGNKWSWGDVVADCIGIILGGLLLLLVYAIIGLVKR